MASPLYPTVATDQRLRIGVIVADRVVPTWLAHMLERIGGEPWAALTALFLVDGAAGPHHARKSAVRQEPE